ncbi:MAG: hypothetical protein Q8N08_05160 [Methanobacteriaceae archaeon]|nr:hypothetical protein [Methanobacteriaceae archaeon]
MDYFNIAIISFLVAFFGGVGLLTIIIFIYFFNYKWEQYMLNKEEEKAAQGLKENLESYDMGSEEKYYMDGEE